MLDVSWCHFASRYNPYKVKRHFQIVISNRPSVEGSPSPARARSVSRVKLFFAGLLFAAVATAVLIVILVLGSILAAIVWIALVLTIAWLILKATVRRVTG